MHGAISYLKYWCKHSSGTSLSPWYRAIRVEKLAGVWPLYAERSTSLCRESISPHQFLGQMDKPDVNEYRRIQLWYYRQNNVTQSRSTADIDGGNDYLRFICACGKPICPNDILHRFKQGNRVMAMPEDKKIWRRVVVQKERRARKSSRDSKKRRHVRGSTWMHEVTESLEKNKHMWNRCGPAIVVVIRVVHYSIRAWPFCVYQERLSGGGERTSLQRTPLNPVCSFTVGRVEPRLFSFNARSMIRDVTV